MPGINKRAEGRDNVYEAVTTNVVGGMLVEWRTGTSATGLPYAAPAAAGSAVCVGVAIEDAIPTANLAALQTGTDGYGYPFYDVSVPDATFTAYSDAIVTGVTYAAAATYRQTLKCAANGQVTPWVSGTDAANLIVGWCAQPAGVATAGVGLARILI